MAENAMLSWLCRTTIPDAFCFEAIALTHANLTFVESRD